jgi:nitrite reductase/ring-hydroxylating ferredoxin subunit
MGGSPSGPGASIRVENVPVPSEGKAVRVETGGQSLAIFQVGGKLFAIDAKCPHVGGPLDKGAVTGASVTCPLHGSQFDLGSGTVQRGPARRGVQAYSVRVEGTTMVLEKRAPPA